jgi:hypothetical protein
MSKLVLASLCFSLFTSLALAKELIFATEPDGGLFRVFPSGISAYMNQNQDEHTFTTQHTGGVGYDRHPHSNAQGCGIFVEESVKILNTGTLFQII